MNVTIRNRYGHLLLPQDNIELDLYDKGIPKKGVKLIHDIFITYFERPSYYWYFVVAFGLINIFYGPY